MKVYEVLNKRGVHSMAAGKSWYKGQYINEGVLPQYLLDALIADGAIVEHQERVLCAGVTRKGDPCKRAPLEGTEFCQQHTPDEQEANEAGE